VIYSLHFLTYAIFILSLGTMIRAVYKNQWVWWIVSWVGAAFSLFALEYFIGLEVIRPIILWLLVGKKEESPKKRLFNTLKLWSPYCLIIFGFVVWRFFYLSTPMYDVFILNDIIREPLTTLRALFNTVISNMFEVIYLAWEQTLQGSSLLEAKSQTPYLWVIVFVGIFTFFYFSKIRKASRDVVDDFYAVNTKELIVLGILFTLSAGLPIWGSSLKLELSFPEDRLSLPMMIGTSILIVGLIELLTNSETKKHIILALMVGIAAGFHFKSVENYQIERNWQKHLIWNLVWRMPYIKPETIILGDEYPLQTTDDEAMTALINLAYISNKDPKTLPYGFFFISGALGNELPALEKNLPVNSDYGPLSFSGTTSQAIVIQYTGNRCPRILVPEYDDYGKMYPGLLSEAIFLSDSNNIIDEKEMIDRGNLIRYFGEEPTITWCYGYQKAELARQFGKWPRIVNIGKWIFKPGYQYLAPEELFPFIEGYAMTGNFERAAELTYEAVSNTRTIRPELCSIWDRVFHANFSGEMDSSISAEINSKLDCKMFQ